MAPTCCSRIKVSIFTVAFIFSLSLLLLLLLPPISGGSAVLLHRRSSDDEGDHIIEEEEVVEKVVIGSKPPVCVNKCKKCRPCMATLVVPNGQRKKKGFKVWSRGEDDDTYYLLSWKCRCGDKLFQP
ncbi:EPIDERMAL PATTERNING FACTOR-like protein 8 [Senna tora]|uniref:Epidermal patterning factor-like protein n=1 Tax=Senna tora TaxID=362788 RepID=A0A834W8N7_9FABA|nr:EPIDERMAL PATTERNING FACTOR-like protein 8 [Senna tora]